MLEKYITNYLSKKGHNVDNMVKALQRSRAKYGEKLSYEDALEELVCNTMSEIATDEEAMAVFLELNESERKTLISVLRNIANKIREWARSLTGKEYRRLVTESETLRHLANELNKQLKEIKNGIQKQNGLYKSSYEDNGYKKRIEDDIYYPKSERDKSAFIRSMAYKTSTLQDGEIKRIIIYTENDIYFVTADGYLTGNIDYTLPILGNEQFINLLIQEWNSDGDISDPKRLANVLKVYRGSSGNGNRSNNRAKNGRKKKNVASVDVGKSRESFRADGVGENLRDDEVEHYDKKNSYADEIVLRAEEYFGTTRNWNETGYILTNGRQLDFSGKKLGAPGGERTVDHREILDSYDEEAQNNMSGVEAMVDFMRSGNIRIMPETQGVNLSVQPNKEQERTLRDFISRSNGEVILDIDDDNGKTVVSVEYPRGTSASKILADIRRYFEDGTEPYVSEVSKYRYSYADEEVDLWGLLDPEEDSAESTQRSEYLEGFIQTASALLEKTRGIPLSEGRVRGLVTQITYIENI